jgi:hypothetical protein
MMLEDIFGCDHTPILPVSEQGEILYWLCACGREHPIPEPKQAQEKDPRE